MVHLTPCGRIFSQFCHPFCYAKNSISLIMEYKPQVYPPIGKTFLPNLEKQLVNLSDVRDDAQATHKVSQQKMKEQVTAKFSPWKVGDKVWLEMTNLHMGGPKKLQMKQTCPFEVKEAICYDCLSFSSLSLNSYVPFFTLTHLHLLLIHHQTSFLLIAFHHDSPLLTHGFTLYYLNPQVVTLYSLS